MFSATLLMHVFESIYLSCSLLLFLMLINWTAFPEGTLMMLFWSLCSPLHGLISHCAVQHISQSLPPPQDKAVMRAAHSLSATMSITLVFVSLRGCFKLT